MNSADTHLPNLHFSWLDFGVKKWCVCVCVCVCVCFSEEPGFLKALTIFCKKDPEFAQMVAFVVEIVSQSSSCLSLSLQPPLHLTQPQVPSLSLNLRPRIPVTSMLGSRLLAFSLHLGLVASRLHLGCWRPTQ